MNKIYTGGVVDDPQSTDYVASAPNVKIKDAVDLYDRSKKLGFKVLNQKADKFTYNACTAFATTMANQLNNCTLDGLYKEIDPVLQWQRQLDAGASLEHGDRQQNAVNVFKLFPQEAPITEWVTIEQDEQEVMKWLSLGYSLQTMIYWKKLSNGQSNYSQMLRTGYYEYEPLKTLGAHEIVIKGYNKQEKTFTCIESLCNQWGEGKDLGEFDLPFKYLKNTGSLLLCRDCIG
jgi:hypothetical protein